MHMNLKEKNNLYEHHTCLRNKYASSSQKNMLCYKNICPGFRQDRVNFHQNPKRGTAGRAAYTWPNRAGYSIPCAIMLGSGWSELGSGNSVAARERRVAEGGES